MSRLSSLARRAAFAPSLLVLAAAAQAQDAAPAPITKGTADLGFVQTSGNTQVTTFNFGEKITHQRERLMIEQGLAIVYGTQRDSLITNFLGASLRAEYKIDKILAAFANVAFDRNTFAGIERRLEQGIGLQARLFAGAQDTLRIEGGGRLTQQLGTDGIKQDFPSARGAAAWRHGFSPAAYFQQNVEFIPNLKETEDWRVNSESALVAPISARIGLKFSYVIRYDNLPQPGFSEMDRLFTTGIQLTF